MPLYKKGTCYSSVIVSSWVYRCAECGYTEIVRGDSQENKNCSKCQSEMRIISSQTTPEETAEAIEPTVS